MVGDNEELGILADKMLETYSLEELFEINDLTHKDVLRLLLELGQIDQDQPVML